MLTIRSKTLVLCACMIEAVWLLAAQSIGSMVLLLPCLVCFLALVVWGAYNRTALPIFLFFLPFSTLLKLQPETITFYTLALLAAYVVYLITGSRNVPIIHLIPGLCLVGLTFAAKMLSGLPLENSYFLFCVTILLVPYIAVEFRDGCDFYWITLTFAVGIVLAATSSQFLSGSSNIMQYVHVLDIMGIVRRSGYFNDPNFYSAHITVALSGVLVLLLNRSRKRETVTQVCLVVALVYCGLLSVSKSFLLVAVAMALFWAVGVMFQKGKISVKLMVLLCALVGFYFLLSSAMFDTVLSRFVGATNMSALTTGRTDLWVNYLRELGDNPMMLLFGNGYTDVTVGGRAAHNTLIQLLYQFGVVGYIFLIGWFVCFIRTLLNGMRIHRARLTQLAILFIGAFGPWMALDYLFFDEFFLFPIYLCAAIRFMAEQDQAESPLLA
ncbi:MAG: O-antigen ligase family protein [Ruminococcaceae bacterium]|nr:O-antigen ligase family protein [Oscillospiraceae bacterium]